MRKERQTSHAKEFQIMYVDTLPSRREIINPTPEVWAARGDFLPKCTVRREVKE